MRQTLTTLTASIALGLGGLAAAPAPAATAPADVAAVPPRARAPARRGPEKPTPDLHDAIVKRRGRLYFKGRVDPGHGPVVVQKKECSSSACAWKVFKRVSTRGPKERWQVRVFAPEHGNWYWRGYVKAYGGYATSWTHVYKTYVTRS